MENDQGQAPVESSLEDRMMALLDGPAEGEPEDAPEPEQEAQPETEDEGSQEPDEEPEAPEPEYEEILHNGEAKRFTKEEIKSLAQQGFDYTQKTQQLAEARRQFEAQMQAAQQSFEIQNQQIDAIAEIKALDAKLAQFNNANWIQMAETDPVEYLKLNQAFRELKDARDAKVGEFQRNAETLKQQQMEQRTQFLARESELLQNKLPEFRGEKSEQSRQALRKYLTESGFSEPEIGGVLDHRQIVIAWKAMQYDKLKSAQPQLTKKVAAAPKAVKPGAGNGDHNAHKANELRQSLKKTGRQEYAAALIEQML